MRRVINNMKIVRLFSFIILIGAYLSADSNSGNLPAPIPIDFGANNGMRSDSDICESCDQLYDAEVMGASCCDEATFFSSSFTCEVLETTYLWNCSGWLLSLKAEIVPSSSGLEVMGTVLTNELMRI